MQSAGLIFKSIRQIDLRLGSPAMGDPRSEAKSLGSVHLRANVLLL